MVYYKFYRDENGLVCEHLNNGKSIIKYNESAYEMLTSLFKRKYYAVNLINNRMTYTNGTDRIIIDNFMELIKELPKETLELMIDTSTKYMIQVYNSLTKVVEEPNNKYTVGKIKLGLTTMLLTTMLLPLNLQRNAANVESYNLAINRYVTLQEELNDRLEQMDDYEAEVQEVITPAMISTETIEEDLIDEGPMVESDPVPTFETPQVTADNRIYLTSVPQTGISRSYTNYSFFYDKWSSSSRQRKVADIWGALGFTSDHGIATINGRYLVAVATTFGQVGDCIDVALSNGTILPCIIADAKSSNDSNYTIYGHSHGRLIEIIEWDSSGAWDDIDITDIAGLDVTYIQMTGISILNQPIEAFMIDHTDALEEPSEMMSEIEETLIDPETEALEDAYVDEESKVYTLSN